MSNSRSARVRRAIPFAIGAVAALGYVAHLGFGGLSAIGWKDLVVLCPVGALTTMVATRTIIPQGVVSILVAVVCAILFGRMFCSWVCPVPAVRRTGGAFRKRQAGVRATGENAKRANAPSSSRYWVLGAAIVSSALFGFPVFCLLCPIGLSFATLYLVIALFATGDITWSVVVFPALLCLEVVFLRRFWCHSICPLGAFMSLFGRMNKRVLRPSVDESVCIEKGGVTCGKCGRACHEGIDPRHLGEGTPLHECTVCRACVDACPASAVKIPLAPPRDRKPQ